MISIVRALRRSEQTVRNYLIRIFDKLGISSRVELVLYAFSGTEGSSQFPVRTVIRPKSPNIS